MNVVASMALHTFLKDFKDRGVTAYNDLLDANKGNPMVGFGFLKLTGFEKVVELEHEFLATEALLRQLKESQFDFGSAAKCSQILSVGDQGVRTFRCRDR